jgi:hypothetical protein
MLPQKPKYKNNKNKQESLKNMKLCGISKPFIATKENKNKLRSVKLFSLIF